jgi:hypothetical protein
MSEICSRLHDFSRSLRRHTFPYRGEELPENGLYIMFERGETGHGGERITRIGTHTGDGNLPGRLEEHFYRENKDRSIFRKNVGRALLNRSKEYSLLRQWNIDLTSSRSREEHLKFIDTAEMKRTEKEVSSYIRDNISFAVIPMAGRGERLTIESLLIATVAQCEECGPSDRWLGGDSPVVRIAESGLWLVMGQKGAILSLKELNTMEGSIDGD